MLLHYAVGTLHTYKST